MKCDTCGKFSKESDIVHVCGEYGENLVLKQLMICLMTCYIVTNLPSSRGMG